MENSYTKSNREWYPHVKKDFDSCIKEEDGYMTLLACLLFLVVAGLLLVCLDGSMLFQAKARCSMAQTGLTEHLLANYNVPLAKRYQLYFLDPHMDQKRLEEQSEAYYDELFRGSSGVGFFSSPLWRLKTEYIEAVPFGTMQEKEFQFFIAQIEDCMKYDLSKDLTMKILGQTAQETKEHSSQIEETINKLDKNEPVVNPSPDSDDNTLTPSEVAEGEQAGSQVQKNNPLQKLRSILEYGLLGLVTDEEGLSERKIAPSLLPFKNQSENKVKVSMNIIKNLDNIGGLIEEQGLDKLGENLTAQGAVNLYIQNYFNYYKRNDVLKETKLLYEMEYILGGHYSDKENLEYVVNRLVLLRFALNSAYAFGNEELRAQALSMAAMLTGITGTPEFIEAVRYIILAAVNLLESIKDVEALLNGEQVPLFKTTADWKTTIHGDNAGKTGNLGKGLNYQEHTLILLTLQTDLESKCYRMQNLMQMNIQQEEPEFQIKNCKAGISLRTGVNAMFPFYLKDYLLENEQKTTY